MSDTVCPSLCSLKSSHTRWRYCDSFSILRACYWKDTSDLKAYFNLLTSLIKLIWVFHFNINIILTVFIRQETIMLLIASVRSKSIFTETILPSILDDKDYCLDKNNSCTLKLRYTLYRTTVASVTGCKFDPTRVIFHVTSSW